MKPADYALKQSSSSRNTYLPASSSSPRSPYYYSSAYPQQQAATSVRAPLDAPRTPKEQIQMFRAPTRKYSEQESKTISKNLNNRQPSSSSVKGLHLYAYNDHTPATNTYASQSIYDENVLKRPTSTKNSNSQTVSTKNVYPFQHADTQPSTRPKYSNIPNHHVPVGTKLGRPASNYKYGTSGGSKQQIQYGTPMEIASKPMGLTNSQSQGRLIDRAAAQQQNINWKRQVVTPTQKKNIKEQLADRVRGDDANNYNKGLSQYQLLHEKLNSLENKIADMKLNLDKKKKEKETFLEKVQKKKPAAIDVQPAAPKRIPSKERPAVIQTSSTPKGVTTSAPRNQAQSSALKLIVTQVPKQNKELHSLQFDPYSPRHNIYYVSEIVRAYKEDKSLAREHLLTSMQILRLMETVRRYTPQEIEEKALKLPKKQIYADKKTVVFDLDETLIHCNENTSIPYDVKLPIRFPTGEVIQAGINIRPYAVEILRNLSKNFEVIVFTASHSCYANVVLDYLDPEKKYIQHRLYREHCCQTAEGMYVKDLRVIDRSLTDMVLVDNAAYSYAFQLENGIPIIPYYEGSNDYELKALQGYIEGMIWAKDVRDVNRKTFKLGEYGRFDDPDKLVKELYQSNPMS